MAMFPIGWREKHARGTLSALVSCIVHTLLFIGLALTYFAVQEPPPVLTVLQGALAGAEEVSLDFAEEVQLEPPASAELPTPAPVANVGF